MSELAATNIGVVLGSTEVLRDVSLSLRAGEVTAILGPNGAGKSTLLACLAGLRRPDHGEATLGDRPLLDIGTRERARRIAFLEQTPQIAWSLEVRTLVGLGRTPFLGARGLTSEDRAAVDKAMSLASVGPFANRPVDSLSGGERARVLIARSLAGDPEWLLADEPLAGLDPGHQLDAAELFLGLAAEGRGVVVTLHDLTLAARLAQRIIVLAQGRIVADGPPSQALASEITAKAYGVATQLVDGGGGLLVEVIGRPQEHPAWRR
jgi:iron complex transport system ATP-binding protein